MNYNVTKIVKKGFVHSSGFNEVMDSLAWALSSLGHQVNVSENWIDSSDTNIIFGAELLAPNQPQAFPAGTILYNLEQPTHPSMSLVQSIAIGSKATVWDYSLKNVEKWREAGIYARHVPIGFTSNLTRIKQSPHMDIDVLMYGWMTPRRQKIADDLKAAGLNVVATDKCYGGGRDNLISRSRIVLNVHHDGRDMFEIVRCSFLMANYKCVITENSSDDSEYEDLRSGIIHCSYDDIVETVKKTLQKPPHGFFSYAAISRRDYVATVSSALMGISPQEKVARRYAAGCQSGDMKDFMGWIKDHAKGTCLEIGTRDGASTAALLSGVQANTGVVLSVDIQDCGHLFAGHPNWKFIRSSSQNPKLKVPELDLLLVDGDHSREGYRADLERFFPFVKPGGLILSHDISPDPNLTLEALPGSDRPSKYIHAEFKAFALKHNLRHEELPGQNGMGVMYVDHPVVVESDESWEASAVLCK